MSAAWKDMTDIERASALELMGGKRQANILSSLITNFQTVEDVIETSSSASGSALAENEKYLDSIQGRIDLFKNELQTLWTNMLDSDVIKLFVDLGTALLKLVDTMGAIPTAAGVFAAWKFAAKELQSAFNTTSTSTKTLKTKLIEWLDTQKATTEATNEATAATTAHTAAQEEDAIATQDAAAQNVVKEQSSNNSAQAEINDATASQLSRESDQMQGQMSLYSAECNDAEAQSAERARQAELNESESSQLSRESDQMQGQMSWSNLFDGNVPTMHVGGNGTTQPSSDGKNLGIFATMFGKLGSGAAKAGKAIKALSIGLGKGLLVMGAVKVAAWALGKAWDWLDKNIINRAEHIKKEVEELQKTYKEAKNTFDDNLTSLTTSSDTKTYATLADEFAVLTKGVDQYGNNISLTSDQYERYKAICEKIVGIQPSIAAGYDSATKAIGNNANALAQLIELQKYQQSQTVDKLISDENLGKIAENAVNNLNATKDEHKYDEDVAKVDDFIVPLNQAVMDILPKYLDASGNWTIDQDNNGFLEEVHEYILAQLGYTTEQIDDIVSEYFYTYGGQTFFDAQRFFDDYYDQIVANADKFSPELQQVIKDGAAKVKRAILLADEDIETAQNQLVDTLLQVPYSSDARPYYDQLDDAGQKFITEWIKNSSQFKVNPDTTGEDMEKFVEKITNMIRYLVSDDFKNQEITLKSGEQITGQDILDQFYNLDPSTVNWADYKTQKQALLDAFWHAIDEEDNTFGVTYNDLKVSFGVEFIDDTPTDNQKVTEIKSQVAQKLGIEVDELQEWLNKQPASRVQAFYEIKWNDVGEIKSFGDINKLIDNKIPKIVQASGNTFSNYKSTVEDLTGAQSIQNEVIYDNIQLTEEQGETLKTLIGDEADYADAIDSTNGYVVKNVALLNKLISKKKQEAAQNVRTERTQARLKYYELYKRIRQLTGGQGQLAKANAQEINALYKEMGAVEKTIAKYSLLEQKLLGAADAYQKYEDAKAADQEKDYGSKAEEMISGLIEGLQSAKLGTESFKAAVLGMVPEEVYSDLGTVEEKVKAIADYLKNSNFSRYFTLEFEDDGTLKSAEMTLDNVKAFIEDGLNGVNGEKPVFVGEDWQHFELSDDIKTLDDFCKAMNLTKEMAFAMFTEIDSYDAEWLNGDFGSIFDQLDLGLEGNIFMATKTLTELDVALANNEITVDEWATKYQEANAKLQGCAEDARKNAIAYQEASENVDDLKGKLEEATQKLNQMNQPNSGATQEEIDAQTKLVGKLTTQLGEALQKKYNLEEPTELSLQLASDDIDAQIDAWRTRNKNLAIKANIDDIDDSELIELGEDGKYKIKPDVELSENEKTELQKYIDLLNDKGVINLLIGGAEDAKAQIEEVKTAAEAAKKAIEALPDPSIDSTSAITQINNLISAIDRIPTGVTITITYREVSEGQTVTKHRPRSRYEMNSTQYLEGTAHAQGSWGAPKTETALVGELGPELLVRDGRWTTIGTNGTEFTNIKKGDIIFNHKQTEELLKNGYVTGRGRAYANGTSYDDNSLFDRMKRIINSKKLNQFAQYAEEMCKQYEELTNGNVDLRKRPHLSPSYEHELAISGGYNSFIGSDGEIYASTSAETITIGEGESQYTIDITPVLENGEVLTSDALAEYVNNLVTDGSMQDLLDSDKYNLIIHAVPGEYNEKDWSGFEEQLSKYKDGYLDTILDMFDLGGEDVLEKYGFSSIGLADVSRDLQNNGSYNGKEVASAIDDTSEGMRNLDELMNQYVTDVLHAKSLADEIGTDLSKTQYGNIDTDTRQKLYWDENSIDKYSDALDSWGIKAEEIAGTYSTLLSVQSTFDGVDIAFSPMLQTENGPQLLDSNTAHEYIWGLIDKAKENDGQWTSEELFQLDTEGLEFNGTVVKNLLEDIDESASTTAKLLHYVGDTGAIANLEGEIETTASELVATGENISDVQAKLGLLNATNISDKTFTVTTVYQTIGSGDGLSIHTPGGSGRFLVYADGTAHATGNWGLPNSEHGALVGELGPEMVVNPHTGRYYTVGDNGTEFVDLPKGAIIFNHKQTEDLLQNGHITSRGKAYAKGNAHVTIDTDYTTPTYYSGASDDNFWTDWNDTADSLSDAADDLSDAADDFEEVFDWFEVLIEEIDQDLSYMAAALENAIGIDAKNNIQDQMINVNKFKLTELGKGYKLYADYAAELLAKVPEQYRDLAQQGGVALTRFLGEANQEVVDAINNYREWAKKAEDVRIQQQQINKEITSLALQKIQTINDEYDRQIALYTTKNDLLQANIDLLDEEGQRASAVLYEDQIKNSLRQLELLQKKREEMQKEFDARVIAGDIEVGKEEWYDAVAAIQDVDKAIIECNTDIEGFQNSINQLHWDNFDKIIEAIDNVGEEISNLRDLINEEDITDEFGNWTDKGITAMGLLAQEMERAQYRSQQYADEIEYLNKEYAAGKYSVDEYNEKLQELKKGQWDSIKAYEDAKDALVDLNKTRVQAAKDAMQKEIDALSELIDKKKEELSLQKETRDFQKQIEESQKNIASIEKQLAAIQGDNSAAAIARRKQLEAQLAAAREELDNLYYDHSIEKQQEALDDTLENYQDEKDKEMEALDEYLKNVEQVIADSFATITGNTEAIAGTLKEIADEYGISLSESITSPWEQGVNAIGTYQDQLDSSTSVFIEQLELVKQQLLDIQAEADKTAQHLVDAINQQADDTTSATYVPPESPTPPGDGNQPEPKKPAAPATGSSVTVKKSATNFSRDGGNGTRMQSWVPGSTFTVYQVSGSEVLIGRDGQYTGWIKLSDIEGYAKGSKKISKDQLAITDEMGLEEIVLHADKSGRLQYLTKGSSVIPSDISANLMKLGSLDPKDILERNKPKIGDPYVISNNIELNMSFGSLVHVDTVNQDTLPDLQKMVKHEFDNCMKSVNSSLRRYTR